MHYSHAHTPTALSKWAKNMAKLLTKRFSKGEIVPIFVYMGMSGISTMTALSLYLSTQKTPITYVMMYVRKDDEDSHGQTVEFSYADDTCMDLDELKKHPHEFVFVDDFICSGGTLIACALAYQKRMGERLRLNSRNIAVLTGERSNQANVISPLFGTERSPSYPDDPTVINKVLMNARKESLKKIREQKKRNEQYIIANDL